VFCIIRPILCFVSLGLYCVLYHSRARMNSKARRGTRCDLEKKKKIASYIMKLTRKKLYSKKKTNQSPQRTLLLRRTGQLARTMYEELDRRIQAVLLGAQRVNDLVSGKITLMQRNPVVCRSVDDSHQTRLDRPPPSFQKVVDPPCLRGAQTTDGAQRVNDLASAKITIIRRNPVVRRSVDDSHQTHSDQPESQTVLPSATTVFSEVVDPPIVGHKLQTNMHPPSCVWTRVQTWT